MGKPISAVKLSRTLSISELHDGFWLYDETQEMNLSMRAKTITDALVEALEYYQDELEEITDLYEGLKEKVNSFVKQVEEIDGD
jgi:hypothetical protein